MGRFLASHRFYLVILSALALSQPALSQNIATKPLAEHFLETVYQLRADLSSGDGGILMRGRHWTCSIVVGVSATAQTTQEERVVATLDSTFQQLIAPAHTGIREYLTSVYQGKDQAVMWTHDMDTLAASRYHQEQRPGTTNQFNLRAELYSNVRIKNSLIVRRIELMYLALKTLLRLERFAELLPRIETVEEIEARSLEREAILLAVRKELVQRIPLQIFGQDLARLDVTNKERNLYWDEFENIRRATLMQLVMAYFRIQADFDARTREKLEKTDQYFRQMEQKFRPATLTLPALFHTVTVGR